MRNNLITVLIPTRERADLLASAIRSCTVQKYENCKFIVSDNASQDDTREVISSFNDPRVVYVNPGRRLSMADNFEFALSHAGPGYVISIGDDDALMPDALAYLDSLVDETGADCIAGRWHCYFWDSYPSPAVQDTIYLWLASGFTVKSSAVEVRRALNFNYHYVHRLAGLYYGLISTKVIDQLRYQGKFFQSMTPDSYSAFACSLYSKQFVFSHKPFVVAGLSGKSNGTSQLLNANASEANKFLQENSHTFHDSLVYCPSEPIIMAEAFTQLADRHPELTGGIPLSLKKMCVAALRQAAPNVRPAVEQTVAEIAQRYDLNLQQLKRSAGRPDVGAIVSREIDQFRYPRFLKSLKPLGIENIAQAAEYAASVTEENLHRPHAVWTEDFVRRVNTRLKLLGVRAA